MLNWDEFSEKMIKQAELYELTDALLEKGGNQCEKNCCWNFLEKYSGMSKKQLENKLSDMNILSNEERERKLIELLKITNRKDKFIPQIKLSQYTLRWIYKIQNKGQTYFKPDSGGVMLNTIKRKIKRVNENKICYYVGMCTGKNANTGFPDRYSDNYCELDLSTL